MILVQSSPTKVSKVSSHLQQGYERQRHAALYSGSVQSINTASTSSICEPALLPPRKSTFLATSAIAHRSAGSSSIKSKKSAQGRSFKRNVESAFDRRVSEKPDPGQQRDDSLRLIETLPIGPKDSIPSEDDPHFLKFEPTSGIALRQRKMPHQEVISHLEGRYYIPISTLYSIAIPQKYDDGDFSIPVEGDWLTMGVVIKRSEVLYTKPMGIDHLGRMMDQEGLLIEDSSKSFLTQQEKKTSNAKNGESIPVKEIAPKRFIVFTLLDISSPPDKFGQHDGSREIELAVFESDSSTVESGGERKYYGGSYGAYEKLVMATCGLVVCILNPKVKKGYAGKKGHSNPFQSKKADVKDNEEDFKKKSSSPLRLNARSSKMIAFIGVARDYGQCQQEGCSTFVDKRMKMEQCDYHSGIQLERTQNARPQLQSSWRKSTYGHQGSMSNGMSQPKSKQFIIEDLGGNDPTLPGSKLYDVSTQLGRGKEMRAQDKRKEKAAEENQSRQDRSRFRNELSEEKLKEKALAKIKLAKQEQADKEGNTRRKGILNDISFKSAESKVMEASRKAVLERKRQAELESDNKRNGARKVAKRTVKEGVNQSLVKFDAPMPVGSYQASNGDVKVLSDISSRLLSRHSKKPSDISKQFILRRKKVKLPPTVRPPPGESFYADESSDEEFNMLMQSEEMDKCLVQIDQKMLKDRSDPILQTHTEDSESDLEILPN